MNFVIIDPGNLTGWAAFSGTSLIEARVCAKREFFQSTWVLPGWMGSRPLVVIEAPRWYPHDHSDVNDLLDLSVYVGELKRFYEAMGCVVELVWPRTWKGNVPKKITNRRTVAALSPGELELLPRRPRAKDHDHNMIDAVGLGLWKLGRLR